MLDNLEEKKEEAGTPNPQIDELTPEKAKRYKEQLAWSKLEADRLRTFAKEIKNVAIDSNSLIELNKKDPKMANEVAIEFWYESFDDAKTTITWEPEKKEIKTSEFTEDDFEKMYLKRKWKEEHEKALKKADKLISNLDDWLQEQARKYFNKISEGKKLDDETALEFAEMATLYVSKDKLKSDKYSDWLAMLSSTGITNTKKGWKDKWPEYVVRNWRLILLSND